MNVAPLHWKVTTAFKLRHCAHATKSGAFSTSVDVLEQAAKEIVLLENEVLRCGGTLPEGYTPQIQQPQT